MAYVRKGLSSEIKKNLSKAFPEFKFSVKKLHYSKLNVTITAGPKWLTKDGNAPKDGYLNINEFYAENYAPEIKEMLEIINCENYDNSDIQRDYFEVGYYLSVSQGSWDKPFVLSR